MQVLVHQAVSRALELQSGPWGLKAEVSGGSAAIHRSLGAVQMQLHE